MIFFFAAWLIAVVFNVDTWGLTKDARTIILVVLLVGASLEGDLSTLRTQVKKLINEVEWQRVTLAGRK